MTYEKNLWEFSSLAGRRLWRDLIAIFNNLSSNWREDRARLNVEKLRKSTGNNERRLDQGKLLFDAKNISFHCEDDDVLEQVTQRGCGISSQENSKHSHKGVALSNVQSQKWI